jgi:hypothetical protein
VNVAQSITILFNNPIKISTVSSSQFSFGGFNCFFDDNGSGLIRIFRYSSGTKVVVKANAGTINYTTGKVILNDFAPTTYVDDQLKFNVTPDQLDVTPVRDQILLMNAADAQITTVGEYE